MNKENIGDTVVFSILQFRNHVKKFGSNLALAFCLNQTQHIDCSSMRVLLSLGSQRFYNYYW